MQSNAEKLQSRFIYPNSNATLIKVLDLETSVTKSVPARQAFYASELLHWLKEICEEFEHTPCSSMSQALAAIEKAEDINANA